MPRTADERANFSRVLKGVAAEPTSARSGRSCAPPIWPCGAPGTSAPAEQTTEACAIVAANPDRRAADAASGGTPSSPPARQMPAARAPAIEGFVAQPLPSGRARRP